MADNVDGEIFLENDDFVHCGTRVWRSNPTTGLPETIDLSGRTDGIVFLSTLPYTDTTATAIHASLSKTLVETLATSQYSTVIEGADKTTHLAAFAEGTKLHRHWKFGSDFHVSKEVILRKTKTQ